MKSSSYKKRSDHSYGSWYSQENHLTLEDDSTSGDRYLLRMHRSKKGESLLAMLVFFLSVFAIILLFTVFIIMITFGKVSFDWKESEFSLKGSSGDLSLSVSYDNMMALPVMFDGSMISMHQLFSRALYDLRYNDDDASAFVVWKEQIQSQLNLLEHRYEHVALDDKKKDLRTCTKKYYLVFEDLEGNTHRLVSNPSTNPQFTHEIISLFQNKHLVTRHHEDLTYGVVDLFYESDIDNFEIIRYRRELCANDPFDAVDHIVRTMQLPDGTHIQMIFMSLFIV